MRGEAANETLAKVQSCDESLLALRAKQDLTDKNLAVRPSPHAAFLPVAPNSPGRCAQELGDEVRNTHAKLNQILTLLREEAQRPQK